MVRALSQMDYSVNYTAVGRLPRVCWLMNARLLGRHRFGLTVGSAALVPALHRVFEIVVLPYDDYLTVRERILVWVRCQNLR
jgi:hypothetical protein